MNKHNNTNFLGQHIFAASYCISRFEYLLKKAMNIETISDCFSKQRQDLEGLCEKFVSASELNTAEDYFDFMCGIEQDAQYEENPLELYDDAIKHLSCNALESELQNEELSDRILSVLKEIEKVTYTLDDLGLMLNTQSLLHKGKMYLKVALAVSRGGVPLDLTTGTPCIKNILEPRYVISGDAKEQFVEGLQSITKVIVLEQNDKLIRIECPETTLSMSKKDVTSNMIMKLLNELTGSIKISQE